VLFVSKRTAASRQMQRRGSLKGMPPWLALPIDISLEATSVDDSRSPVAPPTEPAAAKQPQPSQPGFVTPDGTWPAGKGMTLGSPLFSTPPRATAASAARKPPAPKKNPQPALEPEPEPPSLVERTLSALSSLLTTDTEPAAPAATTSATRPPPPPLSPPPAIRSAPPVLPSAW
jgi:hypothetical protein